MLWVLLVSFVKDENAWKLFSSFVWVFQVNFKLVCTFFCFFAFVGVYELWNKSAMKLFVRKFVYNGLIATGEIFAGKLFPFQAWEFQLLTMKDHCAHYFGCFCFVFSWHWGRDNIKRKLLLYLLSWCRFQASTWKTHLWQELSIGLA